MAERENKKKLTKDELHAENEKLRSNLKQRDFTTKEEQQRIVDILRPVNMLYYALVVLLPIIGVFLIWKKKDDLKLNHPSVVMWTMVGAITLFAQLRWVIVTFNLFS